MIEFLIAPFAYDYMIRAMFVCAAVGGSCAFLSCFLILKGWSLMGDALAHSIVPGVAAAYILALPYAISAFVAGGIAAALMIGIKFFTKLREDAIIGIVFTTLFAVGLTLSSISPIAINIETIVLGNVLAISSFDALQAIIIASISFLVLLLVWKNLALIFFDETHGISLGLNIKLYYILFFTLLSACCVAALQSVGACLVISMVITPGATAYLLTDRFNRMIIIAVILGIATNFLGAYASYFLDTSTGGLIVLGQVGAFLIALFFAPKYGIIKRALQS